MSDGKVETDLNRRNFLRAASVALALIPVVIARSAHAINNVTARTSLHYQNVPQNDMRCASCLEFIPGKTNQDLGACKIIPGDDEIAPNAYCSGWNTL